MTITAITQEHRDYLAAVSVEITCEPVGATTWGWIRTDAEGKEIHSNVVDDNYFDTELEAVADALDFTDYNFAIEHGLVQDTIKAFAFKA